jgi:hypothetical protein
VRQQDAVIKVSPCRFVGSDGSCCDGWCNGLSTLPRQYHDVVRLGGLQAVLQATVGNGLSFDPLSFGQDSRAAPAIDVGGGEIVDAFVVSAVVSSRR